MQCSLLVSQLYEYKFKLKCVQNIVQFTCDCEWLMLSQVSASQRGSEW